MKLRHKKFEYKNRASALLLAFFLMSVLITLAISVSALVMRDTRTVRIMVSGEQSLYAAEGMSELGLFSVKENLPGYEMDFGDYTLDSGAVATLAVTARDKFDDSTIPCDSDEWRALKQNESMQIPLFAQTDSEGSVENIDGFYVEFYVGDSDGNALTFPLTTDVLRWKVLGLNDGSGKTEAMSEYIPLVVGHTMDTNPTIFGTEVAGMPDGYSNGKSFTSVHGPYSTKFKIYSIESFLIDHSYNYLVLTNIITEGVGNNSIYFRFHSTDADAVCEYVSLASTSTNSIESVRQELITLVSEGENLPVFDFVLYHTKGETVVSHD